MTLVVTGYESQSQLLAGGGLVYRYVSQLIGGDGGV